MSFSRLISTVTIYRLGQDEVRPGTARGLTAVKPKQQDKSVEDKAFALKA